MRRVFLVSRCAWTLHTFRASLIGYLQSRAFDVHAAGAGNDGYADRVSATGAQFHDIPLAMGSPFSPLADLRLVFSLFRLYRRTAPQIVHHFTIKPVIYGSIAARLARVPRVVNTITGLGYAFTDAPRLVRSVISFLYRTALRTSDVVFFQNADDKALFLAEKLVREEQCRLVPGSGIDIEYFSPKRRKPRSDSSVNILFVGRLLRDKGIYEYLEAAKYLQQTCVNAKCHLVGDFDERNPTCISRSDLDAAIAMGAVVWHGKSDDVRSHLETADIVVLPSYREGTPRSLLEAAAMGLPIVTTDVPGCRNVVENDVNGCLVAVKNSIALGKAIRRLAGDSDLRNRMGQAGRRKIEHEFDEKLVFEATWNAYNPVDVSD